MRAYCEKHNRLAHAYLRRKDDEIMYRLDCKCFLTEEEAEEVRIYIKYYTKKNGIIIKLPEKLKWGPEIPGTEIKA